MNLTTEQLKAMGYVESSPGILVKCGKVVMRAQQMSTNATWSDSEPSGAIQTPPKATKRIRQSTKPLLNKLEGEFLQWLYDHHRHDYTHIRAQSKRFKLGNGIWYKPDFTAIDDGKHREIAWEVKGKHSFRGGFENLKVAAGQYPEIMWNLVWMDEVGHWCFQTVLP